MSLSYCDADSCGTVLLAGPGVVVIQQWSSGTPQIRPSVPALSRPNTVNDAWSAAGHSTLYTCK